MKNPKISDLSMTNFPGLRQECLKRLYREPLAQWTAREIDELGDLFAQQARVEVSKPQYKNDWRANPGLLLVVRDTEEIASPRLPKWVALVSWLTPESASGYVPGLVAELTTLALSGQLGKRKTAA